MFLSSPGIYSAPFFKKQLLFSKSRPSQHTPGESYLLSPPGVGKCYVLLFPHLPTAKQSPLSAVTHLFPPPEASLFLTLCCTRFELFTLCCTRFQLL